MDSDEAAVTDHALQTRFSAPGVWAMLFDEIEPTIASVGAMARNVIAHYRAQADDLPQSTQDDVSLRWVEAILATDQERHGAPLTVERQLSGRVQGCCRDHTLIAVAALRHHGVAARSRVGFARYLSPTWNADHVIVEAWMDGRWRCFDAEFGGPWGLLSDPTDIGLGPDGQFLTAAHTWRGHRAGELDVSRFGVAEGLPFAGDWFVYNYVIEEVAHRFGDELLLWDQWGAMTGDLSTVTDDNIALIDEVAFLSVRADEGDLGAERELLALYREDDRLHPGPTIHSISPVGPRYFETDLATRATWDVSPPPR